MGMFSDDPDLDAVMLYDFLSDDDKKSERDSGSYQGTSNSGSYNSGSSANNTSSCSNKKNSGGSGIDGGCGCLIAVIIIGIICLTVSKCTSSCGGHEDERSYEVCVDSDSIALAETDYEDDTCDYSSYGDEDYYHPSTSSSSSYNYSSSSYSGSYDDDEYDEDGYDKNGYDRNGYDRDGYDEEGYDEEGIDEDGYSDGDW